MEELNDINFAMFSSDFFGDVLSSLADPPGEIGFNGRTCGDVPHDSLVVSQGLRVGVNVVALGVHTVIVAFLGPGSMLAVHPARPRCIRATAYLNSPLP